MISVLFPILPLAQLNPWDDPPPPPPTQPTKSMSFSDLQQAIHAAGTGQDNDNSFRNGILIIMAVIGIIALVIHLRQRHMAAGPPDSIGKLSRELGRLVQFPLGSRLMLMWVARSTGVPMGSLLLSSALFDKSVAAWAAQPTFSVARHWGQGRLQRLRPALFTA